MTGSNGDPASPSGSHASHEAPDGSSPSVSIPIANWATDEMIEPLAMAICYGGFLNPARISPSPAEYWPRVKDAPREEYRRAARILLQIAQGGCRLMPREPSSDVLERYMRTNCLSNTSNAAKHYRAIYTSLPGLWAQAAQGIEARRAETPSAAPSSDEIPVAEGHAPEGDRDV